jgi:hypothetical protein
MPKTSTRQLSGWYRVGKKEKRRIVCLLATHTNTIRSQQKKLNLTILLSIAIERRVPSNKKIETQPS